MHHEDDHDEHHFDAYDEKFQLLRDDIAEAVTNLVGQAVQDYGFPASMVLMLLRGQVDTFGAWLDGQPGKCDGCGFPIESPDEDSDELEDVDFGDDFGDIGDVGDK